MIERHVFAILRPAVVAALCCTLSLSVASGQSPVVEPIGSAAPALWRPYVAPQVPPVRLTNSGWVKNLIRAGNLYLTVQDAIALVLENNIDIAVARYNPVAALWQIERAEAGGALPPPLSLASQVGSVAPGQGVIGSETSADVIPTQNSSPTISRSSNVTMSPVGTVAQTFDPVFQEASVVSHTSLPQFNSVLSDTSVLLSNIHASTGTLQEGFLTGGSVSATYTGHYLHENALTDILNPSVAANVSVSLQHNLLRGFGVAVNARYIAVAKIDERISDLYFKLQVTNAVARTLQLYYALVVGYEDVRAKESALELAQELYNENKRQAEVGTLTSLDVTTAEAQLAASQRDLLFAETTAGQEELQLKNLLSRTGPADPLLRDARIVPLDGIAMPPSDDLPPLETLVQQALRNRADLAVEKATIEAAQVSAIGTRNGILPVLQVFGSEADAGLAGTRRTIAIGKATKTPDAFFAGGTGTALGQVFRRDFPTDRVGASFQAPILNRQAQSDHGIDQLSLRQLQLTNEKDINAVQVDLMSVMAVLQQARSRYKAAVAYRILQKQLLDSEREAYSAGTSTLYNIMQAAYGLESAQEAEAVALRSWNNAAIELDEIRGITLETNHVSIAEAKAGTVTGYANVHN